MSKAHKEGNILTLDRGNSALKADVWKDNAIVETVVMPPACMLRQLKALVARHAIEVAMYCSVTDDGSQVKEVLEDNGIKFLRLDVSSKLPIKIDYASKSTLGVDRVAGCMGAWSMFPDTELLVVDLGTAITYDRVTADGVFIGGNIAPGVSLRLKALNAFTARLPKVELGGDVPMWGYDTSTALRSGAIRGIAAEVSFYHSLLPEGSKVVITGGSAPRITPYLEFDYVHEPHLVTIGLKACLNEIVNKSMPILVE